MRKQHGFTLFEMITALIAVGGGAIVLMTLAHFIHKFW